MTPVPYAEALLALATVKGGPEHPADVLDQDEFLLCELCAYFDHHPGPTPSP